MVSSTDGQTDKVNPVYPPTNFVGGIIIGLNEFNDSSVTGNTMNPNKKGGQST